MIYQQFQNNLYNLLNKDISNIAIAVSGGSDSIALLMLTHHWAKKNNVNLTIISVDHNLRRESKVENEYIKNISHKLGYKHYILDFNHQNNFSNLQARAREARYQLMTELCLKLDILTLLTAHHLDDNIETMLMHFFRGTGIAGLKGMPLRNGKLVRPLLSVPRNIIKEFANSQNLTWVEDSSNDSDDYTRNFFRNRLIPSLIPVLPEIHMNLEKNLHRFSEAYDLYYQAVEFHKKKLLRPNGNEIHIPILLLKKTNPLQTIIYEIIKEYGFSPPQSEELIWLMDSVNGKSIISISHRVIINRR